VSDQFASQSACVKHRHRSADIAVATRAVPDLLLRNPAGAGFCRICKAKPAGAGAGFHQ